MGKVGELLSHPDELLPLIKMYYAAKQATKLPKDADWAFCYGMLNDVSRSFAVVIQELPQPLRDAVCVFYLVLRGLDTVEDDMALDDSFKLPHLLSFHKSIYREGFTMQCGYKHYKRLMSQFDIVVRAFLSLEEPFQDTIADITRRMGEGMAKYIQTDVKTVAQYDEYCFYVAGLVGVGLSELFAASGLESEDMRNQEDLANHMGLLLQKTNIIRDYLEDIMEEPAPRMFWPQEIWGRYGATLNSFAAPANREQAVQCLNHMVVDALQHVPHCVRYMQSLRNAPIFRFCAIPQIMALGTLSQVYNNGKVFEGVVKMRRGQTAAVFQSCSNMGDLLTWFLMFMKTLQAKASKDVLASDPTRREGQALLASHITTCNKALKKWRQKQGPPGVTLSALLTDYVGLVLAGVYFYVVFGLGQGLPELLPQSLFANYLTLHRVIAAVLLLLTVRMTVFVRH